MQSRTDEAIVWLEKSRSANPAPPIVHALLASAYALRGETERAAAELAEARRLGGEDLISSIARLRAASLFEVPAARDLYEIHLSLRSAQGRGAGGMNAAESFNDALGADHRPNRPERPDPRFRARRRWLVGQLPGEADDPSPRLFEARLWSGQGNAQVTGGTRPKAVAGQ